MRGKTWRRNRNWKLDWETDEVRKGGKEGERRRSFCFAGKVTNGNATAAVQKLYEFGGGGGGKEERFR